MKILEGEILFEHLAQPSRSVIGERDPIKAKTPSFVSSNAKGDVRSVENLTEVENLGKVAASRLKTLFA